MLKAVRLPVKRCFSFTIHWVKMPLFDPDEEPTAAKLFDKIQQNPEQQEQESFQTTLRRLYAEIDSVVKQKINKLPQRIKVAKQHPSYALTVFIKKGSGLFISNLIGDEKKPAEECL